MMSYSSVLNRSHVATIWNFLAGCLGLHWAGYNWSQILSSSTIDKKLENFEFIFEFKVAKIEFFVNGR